MSKIRGQRQTKLEEKGKKAYSQTVKSMLTASCPHCDVERPDCPLLVDILFGYRRVRGIQYPQSWCRYCRGKFKRVNKGDSQAGLRVFLLAATVGLHG